MRAAIIVALEEELSNAFDCLALHGKFLAPKQSLGEGQTNFRYKMDDGTGTGRHHDCEIFLINGMGNVAASAFVGRSFLNFEPDLLISVGISGSMSRDDVRLEDVVISNQVKYYAPDKVGEFTTKDKVKHISSIESAGEHIPGEYRIDSRDVIDNIYLRYLREHIILSEFSHDLDLFFDYRQDAGSADQILLKDANLVRGTILGSNWVLDSGKYAEYLHWKNENNHLDFYKMNRSAEYAQRCSWGNSSLHAVDMETYGFFKAIHYLNKTRRNKVPGFAIRGISDYAAGKSDLDNLSGGSHRAKAVENAMLVTIEFLRWFAKQDTVQGQVRSAR